jgi:alkylmercury lyase
VPEIAGPDGGGESAAAGADHDEVIVAGRARWSASIPHWRALPSVGHPVAGAGQLPLQRPGVDCASTLDIPTLAAEFTAAHPELQPSEQRLALALFRLLAEGEPLGPQALADRAELPENEVASALERLPMLQRDDEGRVLAYGGLTLEPTAHVLEVDGRTLYTWCALDTLFLPQLLGRPARVRSACPQTGTRISLTVDAGGAHDVTPGGAVMTLHAAEGLDLADVVGTFCCYVHFFASEQAAREWARRSDGTYVASIADGFEYGRIYNQGRLGGALANRGR